MRITDHITLNKKAVGKQYKVGGRQTVAFTIQNHDRKLVKSKHGLQYFRPYLH